MSSYDCSDDLYLYMLGLATRDITGITNLESSGIKVLDIYYSGIAQIDIRNSKVVKLYCNTSKTTVISNSDQTIIHDTMLVSRENGAIKWVWRI